MPKIQEYSQQFTSGGAIPVDPGVQPGEIIGRGLEQLGTGVRAFGNAIFEREQQKQISDVNAKLAAKQAQMTVKFQEAIRNATPGDDKIAEKFLEEFDNDEELQQIKGELTTPGAIAIYENNTARLRAHFFEQSFEAQAGLAAEKVVIDANETIDNLSASTLNDPSSLEMNLANFDESVVALEASGVLPDKNAAAKLRKQGRTDIVKNAVRGFAKLDPEFTISELKKGRWDEVGGDLKVQLIAEAEQEIRAREIEAERRRVEAKRLQDEKEEVIQGDMLVQLIDGKLTTKMIGESELSFDRKKEMYNMVKAANKSPVTDRAIFLDTYTKITSGEITTDQPLMEIFTQGLLSNTDYNFLREELLGFKGVEGQALKDSKRAMETFAKESFYIKGVGFPDPIANDIMNQFLQYQRTKEQEFRAAKKPISSLYDRSSKDWLGHEIQSGRFRRTMRDKIESLKTVLGNAPVSQNKTVPDPENPAAKTIPIPAPSPGVKRKPGESITDFLKRTKPQ